MVSTDHKTPCYVVFSTSIASSFLGRSYLLQQPMLKSPSLYSSFNFRDQVLHQFKTRGKITLLYILIFIFFDSKLEDKNSPWNDRLHSLSSTCSSFFHEWNSDLLGLFPNIWTVPNFERIYYLLYVVILSCILFTRCEHTLHFINIHS